MSSTSTHKFKELSHLVILFLLAFIAMNENNQIPLIKGC